MIDIHSHLLPGLDDGAASWDETLGDRAASHRKMELKSWWRRPT